VPSIDLSLLDRFTALADAEDGAILAFATRWGVLEICHHGLPASHVPHRVWQYITEITGVTEDGDVEDNYRPCRPLGLVTIVEPLARWRDLAAEAQAILNIAAHLHRKKTAPVEVWRPLERLYRIDAATLLGEGRDLPELDYATLGRLRQQGIDPVQPRRITVPEQRTLLRRAIEVWLEMGDVAVVFDWHGHTPAIRFGSSSLAGALALQLALAVARSKGLAICTSCGRAYSPTRRPALGRNNYCPDLCGTPAAKRDWAARQSKDS
jgi:hypothetical protein